MRDLTVMQKPELMVGLEFVFMGVDLSACYHKTQTGYEILVTPSVLENNVELTIEELLKQFNGLAGEGTLSEQDVKDKIMQDSNISNEDAVEWEKIKFVLKMIFLNLKHDTQTPENDVTEYAFSLQVDLEGLIPQDITVINIHSLSFNIWNTQRQTILEKMSLVTPETL